jgi:hypothetical protein
MPRRFTLAEAESVLPEIERLIRAAVSQKANYQEAEEELQEFSRRIMMAGGIAVDREKVLAIRSRRDCAAAALKEAIEAIQGAGCLVKDLDIGLVDFPTLFRGEEVYLCWRMGEPGITYWHSVNEGFQGRKNIDQDFLQNHRGDPAH